MKFADSQYNLRWKHVATYLSQDFSIKLGKNLIYTISVDIFCFS